MPLHWQPGRLPYTMDQWLVRWLGAVVSVKKRIDQAGLHAPVVAAVHTILRSFESIQTFETNTQALADLPD
jgi:hypothetical protein